MNIMQTPRFIATRSARLAASALLIGGLAAGAAHARSNPVDLVSNPDRLDYSNVEMDVPDYDVPFKRDGYVKDPAVFRQITEGLPAAKVQALIGPPLEKTDESGGSEWDYQFAFVLPRSENHIICQYKVVFDGQKQVEEAVWRRRQCQDIVQGTTAGH
ncbi:MAG: outer membrane protein assembly factor BamE [Alcaligenaceae bacterium]|nr:outer membrane protein assembly factor BamE [Alcaligenaceae bacterium]